MTTHPGSADALRKALKECRTNIAGYNIRTSDDYRTLMVDFFNEMQRIHAVACAALSADAALSQPTDDVALCKDGRKFLMELATIMGAVDVCADPGETVSVKDLMPLMLKLARQDRERWHSLETTPPQPQERIVGSGRDAVADDLMTPHQAWQNLMDKDDRNSPAEYQDMCLITAKELADYMRRAVADVPQAQVTGDCISVPFAALNAIVGEENAGLMIDDNYGDCYHCRQKQHTADCPVTILQRAIASHSAGAEEGK